MNASAHTHVLLVEDDPAAAEAVRDALDAARFAVTHVTTTADARRILGEREFDLFILDLSLPDGDGRDVAEAARAAGQDAPMLMLTARNSVADRVEGLRRGADDYVGKPFAAEELAARVDALLRRARSGTRHVLRYADVELDLMRRCVRRGALEQSLTSREADLLAFFVRHADEVLPRQRIIDEVWGDDTVGEQNIVNVYVNYLRNKLDEIGAPRLIHAVRGVGYILALKSPRR